MKRGLRWSDDEDDDTSSSSSDDDVKSTKSHTSSQSSKLKPNQDSTNKKKKGVDFEALSQHGYRGGLSVLGVPQPKVQENWTWSKGEETRSKEEDEESFAERQKTRHTIADAEEIANIKTQEKKNLSFQQKEKRKRDLGQASRGKNYVEEEKRLLRDNGVYSGFDS